MENFLTVLKQTAIFMLAAQMILHFLPGDKYTKYGKMIAAIVIFSRLVLPILSLGNLEFMSEFSERVELLELENSLFTQKLENLSGQQENLWMQDLIGSIEKQLQEVSAKNGVKIAKVGMKDDVVVIEVSADSADQSGTQKVIEPIRIDPVVIEEGKEDSAHPVDAGAIKGRRRTDLEKVFAQELGMSQEQVEVIEVG